MESEMRFGSSLSQICNSVPIPFHYSLGLFVVPLFFIPSFSVVCSSYVFSIDIRRKSKIWRKLKEKGRSLNSNLEWNIFFVYFVFVYFLFHTFQVFPLFSSFFDFEK